jgi:hypothetical protein
MILFDIYKQVEENPNLREKYGNQRLLKADSAQGGAMLHGLSELISTFEKLAKNDPSYQKNGEPNYALIFSAGENLDRPNILFNPNYFLTDMETYSRNYLNYVEKTGVAGEPKRLDAARNFIQKRESKENISHGELVTSFVHMVKDMGEQWVGAENLSKVLFPSVNNPEPELYTAGLQYKGFTRTYDALIQNKDRATMKDVFDVLTNEANRIVEGNAKTIEYRYAFPKPNTISYAKLDKNGNELSPFENIVSGVDALIVSFADNVDIDDVKIKTDGNVTKKANLFGKLEDVEQKDGKYYITDDSGENKEVSRSTIVYMVTDSTQFEAEGTKGVDLKPSDVKLGELLNNGTINNGVNVGMDGDDLFVTFMNSPFTEPMENAFDAIKHRSVLAINHPKFKYGVDCFESERDSDRIYFKPNIGMITGLLGNEIGAFSQGAFITKENVQMADSANVSSDDPTRSALDNRLRKASNRENPDFNRVENLALAPMLSAFFDYDFSQSGTNQAAETGRGFALAADRIKSMPSSLGTKHLNDLMGKAFDKDVLLNQDIEVTNNPTEVFAQLVGAGMFVTDKELALDELGVKGDDKRYVVYAKGIMDTVDVVYRIVSRATLGLRNSFDKDSGALKNNNNKNGKSDIENLREKYGDFMGFLGSDFGKSYERLCDELIALDPAKLQNFKIDKKVVEGFKEGCKFYLDAFAKTAELDIPAKDKKGLSEKEIEEQQLIHRARELNKLIKTKDASKSNALDGATTTNLMSEAKTFMSREGSEVGKAATSYLQETVSNESGVDRNKIMNSLRAWTVTTINKFKMAEAIGDPKEVENTLPALKKLLKLKLLDSKVDGEKPISYLEALFDDSRYSSSSLSKVVEHISYFLANADEKLDSIKVNKVLSINPKDEKMFESMDCSASSDSTLFLLGLDDKVEKTVQVLVGPAGTGKTVGLSKLENLGVKSLTTLNSPDALAAMQPDRTEVSVVDGEHMFNTPNYLQAAMRGDMIEGGGVFSFDETVEAVVKLLSETPNHIAQGSLTNLLNKMRGSDIIFTHELGGVNNDYRINGSMLIGNNGIGFDTLPSHLQQRFTIEVSAGTTDFTDPAGMKAVMKNKTIAPAVKVINSASSGVNVLSAANASDAAMKDFISKSNEGKLSPTEIDAVFREISAANKALRNKGITDVCGVYVKEAEKYEVNTPTDVSSRYKNMSVALIGFMNELYDSKIKTSDASREQALKGALNTIKNIAYNFEKDGKVGAMLRDFINTDLVKEVYESSIAKNVRVNPDFVPTEEYAKIAKKTMNMLTSDKAIEFKKKVIEGYIDRKDNDAGFQKELGEWFSGPSLKSLERKLNNLVSDNEAFKKEMAYADSKFSKEFRVPKESYYLNSILSATVKSQAKSGQLIQGFEDAVRNGANGVVSSVDRQIEAFADKFAKFNSLVKDVLVAHRSRGELDFSSNKYPTITHRIAQNVVDYLKEGNNVELNRKEFIANVIKINMKEMVNKISSELEDTLVAANDESNAIAREEGAKNKFTFTMIR